MQVELPANPFKRALAEGRPQIGLWTNLSSNLAVEIVAGSGFDWLLIDTEHSPNELPMVLSQLHAMSAYPTHAVVRPAWNDMVLMKRILDIGAQTLLVPYVQNAEQARAAVASTRYPPVGQRGVSGISRASRFGRVKGYTARAHEELCVLVQVESREALSHIEDMARVEGVDGIFIGPSDLAADMGHPGQAAHAEVQAAIEDGLTRIRKAGKPAGILTLDETKARRYLDLGATFVAVGLDIEILSRGSQALAARFKPPAG
jgi:4-hydroxy-2-oxoheptanedioate aldolase